MNPFYLAAMPGDCHVFGHLLLRTGGEFVEEAFGKYHPINNFLFFIGAVVFGMFFVHPAFLVVSMLLSSTYYFLLKRKKGWSFYFAMLLFVIAISIINPLFNTRGDTVLFTYFAGRAFTLEALLYGAAAGGMFFTVILWFSCYNELMTSDKFTYIFSRFIPSISMIFCMVLRFVPNFKRKAETIAGVRQCVGKSPQNGDKDEKIHNGITILSVLTSWALEGAVITADSMKSRGYGSGVRTSFSIYTFTRKDRVLVTYMTICIALVLLGTLMGGAEMSYLPMLTFQADRVWTLIGLAGYGAFLAVPIGIHLWEEMIWHILKSKI